MVEYAVSSWITHELPVAEAVVRLAEAGFGTVEVSGSAASPLVQGWEADPAGTCRLLAAHGLVVDSVHTPVAGRYLDVPDAAAGAASVAANLIPGEGRIDYAPFLDRLAAAGFSGLRTLEIKPPATDVAGRLCQVAALRQAWRQRSGG